MEIEDLGLPGLKLIRPRRFADARGWFSETWNARAMAAAGLAHDFVQDNHSFSAAAGTLRGLHYQAPPAAQTKLVRCVAGAIWDVAVDVRRGSPTFGRWAAAVLSAENGAQLLAPRGFLHGFLTLTPKAEVIYKVDAHYDAACDGAVAWDDPDLAIAWPLAEAGVTAPILSDKDAAAPRMAQFASPFVYDPSPQEGEA
ncbi:dTDP-4-dehydrorhamnose 3,5-epimerase [Oceanicella actignis]|uniref:dTDP-4-dehydrorhamnose 3,5-epimerase n=1 Tax=Oceanicella actignis TaxID=1189325 RepID=A0A1M7SW84_9RHOB|nr:dTDP-4-dehydrorhamnose 3,5-epimerase [Oceanicella actignis]SES73441.1 dTDP-4-dehydrorhamnose 3,5-epimerase [Oceanicella actignis]SHN62654.1 dTDP-4-dehydrorhamnose 3,5-epimerase [Oceanicella actignis]